MSWARVSAVGRVLTADVLPTAVAEVVLIVGSRGAAMHDVQQGTRSPLDPLAYALLAAAGAAFLLRRHRPVLFAAIVTGAAGAYLASSYAYGPVFLAVVVAMFTVAARRPLAVSVPTTAVVALTLIATQLVGGPHGGLGDVATAVAEAGWAVIPAIIGSLARVARSARQRADVEARSRRAEHERLRLAREVHDVVGHGLSVISLQAGVALHVLDRQPEQAQAALEAIRRVSTDALDELRATLALTRGDADDAHRAPGTGLTRLPGLLTELRGAGLAVEVATTGTVRTVPSEIDLAAFRIVQESLTNVLRHAGAAHAWVRVGYEPDALALEVRDDGTAPVFATAGPAGGQGLAGLRTRAEEFGGTVHAGPDAGGGWLVAARLPTPAAGSADDGGRP